MLAYEISERSLFEKDLALLRKGSCLFCSLFIVFYLCNFFVCMLKLLKKEKNSMSLQHLTHLYYQCCCNFITVL